MKRMSLLVVFASFAILVSNGCLTTKREVKEPTIAPPAKSVSQQGDVEVIGENIEVIAREDTTGRVSAAQEAAAKLISDAKQRSKDLTRDAENIFDIKKHEAEAMAEKIIAEAKKKAAIEKAQILKQAKQEKEQIIKQALADNKKKVTKKTAKSCPIPVPAKVAVDKNALKKMAKEEANKIIQTQKAKNDKIFKKIIANAKKSAADITKNTLMDMIKAKKDSNKALAEAEKHAEGVRKKADEYLTKKMAEADKAVTDFTVRMGKNAGGASKHRAEDEIKAQNILTPVLNAIPKNDYATFSKNFTADLKNRFTKQKFLQTNKTLVEKLGSITNITYLGFIRKGPLTVYMWKANFEKTSKANDMMVRLTLGELDKRQQIFAFDIAVL